MWDAFPDASPEALRVRRRHCFLILWTHVRSAKNVLFLVYINSSVDHGMSVLRKKAEAQKSICVYSLNNLYVRQVKWFVL